jgi:hypothetical protein
MALWLAVVDSTESISSGMVTDMKDDKQTEKNNSEQKDNA